MYLRTVLRSIPSRAAMAEILSPCRCNSRIVITSPSSTTDTPATDPKGDMVGDRQDGAASAAPSDKKLGKFTSTKVGSIYPTLTPQRVHGHALVDVRSLGGGMNGTVQLSRA